MKQYLFERRHGLCLSKMQNFEFAETAALLTFIFNRTGEGRFKNLFDDDETIESNSQSDLKRYYSTMEETFSRSNRPLPDVPTLQKLRGPYTARAIRYANWSRDAGHNKFLNPITFVPMSYPGKPESLKRIIENQISDYIAKEQSLPALTDSREEWIRMSREKIHETAARFTDDSRSFRPKPTKKTSGVESREVVMADEGNRLRSASAPGISSRIKLYDVVVKMRDYLRLLRRLWILARLRDGQENEIPHVRLNQENRPIIHPYFKDINANLYKRLSENMGLDSMGPFLNSTN